MEVKNNHAHVTTQRILNKFIEINFSVGCMVEPKCCLFQDSTNSKDIDEIRGHIIAFQQGTKVAKRC